MSVEFNHTIVPAHDREISAKFLADLLGIPLGEAWGPFLPLPCSNGVTLDFMSLGPDADVPFMHYAFLVTEAEFDGIFGRIKAAELEYFADPQRKQIGEINYNHGGRGVYFMDPSGHGMEVITRPYGSAD